MGGIQRARDKARARGIIDRVNALIEEGALVKFNVDHERIRRLIPYVDNLDADAFAISSEEAQYADDDHAREPSQDLEATHDKYFNARNDLREINIHTHSP